MAREYAGGRLAHARNLADAYREGDPCPQRSLFAPKKVAHVNKNDTTGCTRLQLFKQAWCQHMFLPLAAKPLTL